MRLLRLQAGRRRRRPHSVAAVETSFKGGVDECSSADATQKPTTNLPPATQTACARWPHAAELSAPDSDSGNRLARPAGCGRHRPEGGKPRKERKALWQSRRMRVRPLAARRRAPALVLGPVRALAVGPACAEGRRGRQAGEGRCAGAAQHCDRRWGPVRGQGRPRQGRLKHEAVGDRHPGMRNPPPGGGQEGEDPNPPLGPAPCMQTKGQPPTSSGLGCARRACTAPFPRPRSLPSPRPPLR
jgi:hypothetical protein